MKTASIGGSGTRGLECDQYGGFPEALGKPVLDEQRNVPTPFGTIPVVKVIEVCNQPVIRIPIHGWSFPVPTLDATLALFWYLAKNGIEQVVTDASVGGVRAAPWDLVIPDDVTIHDPARVSVARLAEEMDISPWVRMRKPFCHRIREALYDATIDYSYGEVITGTYYTNPLSVFETTFEIQRLLQAGVTVVGQSIGQEAACARLCNMCYATINPVANYAEGINDGEWIASGMEYYYDRIALPMGKIIWETLELVVAQENCTCKTLGREGCRDK